MRPSYLNLPCKSKNEKVRVPRQVPRHPGLTMIDYYALRERQAKVRRAVLIIVLVIITLAVCMMVL